MIKLTTWSIYSPDGRYLGQAAAYAAVTAFCQYMFVAGKQIREQDIRISTMPDHSQRIVYKTEEYTIISR